jgi:TatD DNase family protein
MGLGFDALAHLDDPRLHGRLDHVVQRARACGIDGWLVAGADPKGWSIVVETARSSRGAWALGVHPWWAATASVEQLDAWMGQLDAQAPPAVGEIGLDALRGKTDAHRHAQRRALRLQLAWARERDRPVILHAVRSLPEVLDVVSQDGLPARGGYIHDFSGGRDLALRAVALGLHLSFGPSLRRPSAHKVRDAALAIPLERTLIETGSPGIKHDREPKDLIAIAKALALLRGQNPVDVLALTGENARRVLHV